MVEKEYNWTRAGVLRKTLYRYDLLSRMYKKAVEKGSSEEVKDILRGKIEDVNQSLISIGEKYE